MAAVSLKDIRKSFRETSILRGVSLDIEDGEFMVFVGPSGCGKSTLLRVVAGLEDIDDGEVWIDEQAVQHLAPARRGIAMVFQSYALYPHMTVEENMAFGLKLAGASRAEVDAQVLRAAGILQLGHLMRRKPRELSGGQRQRVAIGRAIVRKPNVFLFDEPLSNLDAALRVQMRVELARLHKELGATMIYVTHDQIEAMTLGHRIAVLNGGQIEQVGAPLTLYHQPRTKFVAGFIGSPKMNFIDAERLPSSELGVSLRLVDGQTLELPYAYPDLPVGALCCVGIRPEYLSVNGGGGLRARVDVIEQLGEATYVYAGGQNQSFALTAKVAPECILAPGDECAFSFSPGRVHLFDADGVALARDQ